MSEEEKQHIAVGTVRCSENQVLALTMSRLTHSLYTTRRVRMLHNSVLLFRSNLEEHDSDDQRAVERYSAGAETS